MVLRLNLTTACYVTVISAYVPVMTYCDKVKEKFYNSDHAIKSVHLHVTLIVQGNFHTRAGRNHEGWPKVIGKHGVGKEN